MWLKKVKRRGEAATDEYKAQRRDDMPSSAQWVFEQILLTSTHATVADLLKKCDELKAAGLYDQALAR